MKITGKLLKSIASKVPASVHPLKMDETVEANGEWIASELNRMEFIESEVRHCDDMERQADAARDKAIREARAKLKDIQSRCPHYDVEYVPDASGNNDSFTRCNTCRKEL